MKDILTPILKKTSIFKELDDGELHVIKSLATKVTLPENTKFIDENTEDFSFYLLLFGNLMVTKKTSTGLETIIAEITGIRIIGETGLLTGEKRTASITTINCSTLLKFNAHDIKKYPKIHEKILASIARELFRKLRDANCETSSQIEKAKIMEEDLMIDPLTKTFNRRYLMNYLNILEQRTIRDNVGFSILMIDIDNFKIINDTYGHPIGDVALQAFAKTCQLITRKPDCICRYGGEEFVIVLHNSSLDEAVGTGNRIREEINKITVSYENCKLHFSVSIGAASFHVHTDTIKALIARADDALYQAKKQGKNQVCAIDLHINGNGDDNY